MTAQETESEFEALYCGRLWSLLSWQQLTDFWARIDRGAGWYLYAVGEPVPTAPAAAAEVERFIAETDALLRKEHHHDYCGIVYADDVEAPRMVKIYDPNNLGVSCGFSKNPPPPGWVMSRVPPVEVQRTGPLPESRRRWWQSLFLG
ncbi:MAG: hypothetical protein KF853_02070 [Rhodocyclaceae bacterium]|nr:hypothetical protein [Rhodocyclaceae bacterium]MCP5296296.1 hypothetical protein [Zoogloeaceae bacterium]PKO68830.1 MAG: hypothetical protein CVU20_12640 [Betaproteobacteria bacterium HGW-Betaproteobacteria-14]MBX3675786.1 hypothetical protein [Rhodocyclaceae bacterium]MCB1893364.1 hypothetical protein [Rhodocyclaceae bacterium]